MEGKIWELRAGTERIFYFIFIAKKTILLHGFTKKQNKIPKKEIQIAKK
ncbi:MAG: type II toxin-antitoxin system RelE/ParE family toxin [Ignavibacteriae bacterium]|nr:type II toxin-antitoxin system RelE/ParE family toxin [Ignavibacteriota bacterium]